MIEERSSGVSLLIGGGKFCDRLDTDGLGARCQPEDPWHELLRDRNGRHATARS